MQDQIVVRAEKKVGGGRKRNRKEADGKERNKQSLHVLGDSGSAWQSNCPHCSPGQWQAQESAFTATSCALWGHTQQQPFHDLRRLRHVG